MKELFTYLCNFSLITSVAVLLAVLLRPLLKKGPSFVRCILWALVFLRLAVPVGIAELSAPFAISQESVSLPNGEGNLAEEVVDPVQKPVQTPSVQTPTVQPSVPGSGSAPQQATSQQVMQQVQQQVPQEKIDVLRILSAVWAVGVVAMLGYMLASNLLLRHRVRNAIVYDSRIRVIDRDCSPFVFGFFRPIIYIPASVNKADWPHIIAHESSHIKRLDHLLKPFAFFVLCFYWYNPLVWAAYILLGKDIEYACDEKTVKSMESDGRKAYSLALLAVSQGENILLAPPLSFGRVSAKERVKRVMNRRIPAWAVGLAVVLCASLAVLIIFTVVSADRSEADASAGADNSDPSSPEAEENVSASSDPEDLSEPSDPEEPGGMTDGSVTLYNDDGSIRCVEDYAGGWLVKRTNYLDGKVDLITEYDHWNVIRETTFGNNGEVIVWDHDETGALLTKTVYNADGDVDSIGEYTDNFLTKETTYAFGRVLYVTSYEYGPHGKPTLTSYYDRDGILSSYLVNEYDGEGRMLRESLYEADGTLHRDLIVEEFDANGNQSRWSNYIYDGEGNPTYENHFYYENGELKVDEIVHDA